MKLKLAEFEDSGICDELWPETESNSNSTMSSVNSVMSSKSDLQIEDLGNQTTTMQTKLKIALESNIVEKDVTFIVGRNLETVSAHKFVLSLASSIFAEMLRPKELKPILLPEISPLAFQSFLKFIYTDECELEELSTEVIVELIRLAKRFEIFRLLSPCYNLLKRRPKIDNAIQILEIISEGSGNDELHQIIMDFIIRNASEIFDTTYFLQAHNSTIWKIVASNQLSVKEIDIFHAVLRWAKTQNSKNPLSNNIRNCLGEILYLIRYPLMSADEFVVEVMPTEILTPEESCQILQYISVASNLKSNFKPKLFSTTRRDYNDSLPKHVNNQNFKIYTKEILHSCLREDSGKIMLTNCQLNWSSFTSHLSKLKSSVREVITSLVLKNITFLNVPEESMKHYVRLSSLQNFHMSISSSHENNPKSEDYLFNSICSKLPQILFFVKKTYTSLWVMDVNILISSNGTTLLKIDNENGSVVLNKLENSHLVMKCLSNSDEIRSIGICFKETEKYDTGFLSAVESVKQLTLQNVKCLSHSQFHPFLYGFSNLTDLVLTKCGYLELVLENVIRMPMKLKRLSLSNAVIKTKDELVQFNNVEELSLWNCLWDDDAFDLCNSFPHLIKLSAYNNFVDKNMCKMLADVLNIKTVEKVMISGYLWGIQKIETQNGIDEKIKKFLNELGISQAVKSLSLLKFEKHGRKEWKAFEMRDQQIIDNLFLEFKMCQFYNDTNTFSKSFFN